MIPDSTTNDPEPFSESSTVHDVHNLAECVPIVPASSIPVSRTMSVAALAEQCIREFEKYGRGELSDDQYGLELFKRALMQSDSLAWEAVQQCFDGIMHSWMGRHPLRDAACRLDSEENYVAQGFARFWQATVNNQEIAFRTLGAALKYLRASLHAVIIDTLRTYSRARVVKLPEPGEAGEPLTEDHYDGGELWQIIGHLITDERERRVVYLLYYCGLKPREIVQFRCLGFENVQEIYHIRRMLIERLQRHADYLRWRLSNSISGE